MPRSSHLFASAAIGLTLALSAGAQTESGRFVTLRGADTVNREEFTRTPTSLSGNFANSNGGKIKYEARLLPNGAIERLEFTVEQPGRPTRVIAVQQTGDNIVHRVASDPAFTVAGRDFVPTLGTSVVFYEQAIRRGLAMGGTSATVPWLRVLTEPKVVDAVLTKPAADSAILTIEGSLVMHFEIDKDGRVMRGRNAANTLQIVRLK